MARTVTGGQAGELPQVPLLLDAVQVRSRRGRVRRRPCVLIGDKGYSYRPTRAAAWRRGIRPMLPRRKDQTRRVGRPPQFDRALYRERNRVERAIGRLKEYRRVATRYEKLATNYLAAVDVAYLHVLLREVESSDRT